MPQRTTLMLSAAITVFLLVVIGGVAARVSIQSAAQPAATPPAAPIADPQAALAAQAAEREAAYQQRLAEANARIEQSNEQLRQAYAQQQQLAGELNNAYAEQQAAQPAPAAPAPAAQPPAPTYAVSADQAREIALAAAPGAQLSYAPELVNFEGAVAYEAALDIGTIYIDANSGQILYNGAAQVAAQPSYGDDHGGDDDHGHGGDDDHGHGGDDDHEEDD